MAAANVYVLNAKGLVVSEGASNAVVSQAALLTADNYPAGNVSAFQAAILSAVASSNMVTATQVAILVAGAGRTADPTVRVWTFTLDGHDFYVIRLGNDETLVYDTHSKQWSTWGSGTSPLWRAFTGVNWPGSGRTSAGYGSNIIVGDDGIGALYFLSPDSTEDDDAVSGDDNPHSFTREATGQIALTGYDAKRVFNVSLQGSVGEGTFTTDLANVYLSYSDDGGHTYNSAGACLADMGDYGTRLTWRSIGSVRYPGRLFKITDTGALARVDSLDVDLGEK